jgi:hypothetical protein
MNHEIGKPGLWADGVEMNMEMDVFSLARNAIRFLAALAPIGKVVESICPHVFGYELFLWES